MSQRDIENSTHHDALGHHCTLSVWRGGMPKQKNDCGQSLGNFAASAVAGLLYTTISPRAAFLYLAAWMLIAVAAFIATKASTSSKP